MTRLDHIYEPIKRGLLNVSGLMRKELLSKDDFTSRLTRGILHKPGKRLRSALTLFSAYAVLGEKERKNFEDGIVQLAAGIELIHAAALVHDDVMDHALSRRNRPSINARFGYETAIALGDYIYSKGIEVLSRLNNPKIVQCVTSAALGMCEGELMQVLKRRDMGMKKHAYITIIKKKTALLMSSSCASSIILIDKPDAFVRAFSEFGLNFGLAFQIIDDCLDLVGSEKELGKAAGSDLRMGELTLPVLLAAELNPDVNMRILARPAHSPEMFLKKKNAVKELVLVSGALNKARHIALAYMAKAQKSLRPLRDSVFKEQLMALTKYIPERLTINPGMGHASGHSTPLCHKHRRKDGQK